MTRGPKALQRTSASALLIALSSVYALPALAEDGYQLHADLMGYAQDLGVWSRSPFLNMAGKPANSWNLEVRPELDWQDGGVSTLLRPRTLLAQTPNHQETHSWLNEGWLRWRVVDGISLQGGREVLLWGPSMFWNPSNPFFATSNKATPEIESAGKDFLRTRFQLAQNWALTGISQVGSGYKYYGSSHLNALKVDWVGDTAAGAALVSAEPGKRPATRGWLQWTASDSLLLYGEAAWATSPTYSLAQSANTPTGYLIVPKQSDQRLLGVLGAAYTFENNWTMQLEAWHNGNGLNSGEAHSIAETVNTLGNLPHGLADAQLNALLAQASPLRRNYAGLQLANEDSATIAWKVRLTRNMDDSSMESVAILDYGLDDHNKLWFNLMHRTGRADSEYGRWVRYANTVGFTHYFW